MSKQFVYDFLILTPTYNRAQFLQPIMEQLIEEANRWNFSVHHIIMDDASDWRNHDYKNLVRRLPEKKANKGRKYSAEHIRNTRNLGREMFWKTWDTMVKRAQKFKWHHCIAIPDDHELCNDFLYRVREAFVKVRGKDSKAVAMNILVNALFSWHMNRFVDGAFICNRNFFYAQGWTVYKVGLDWLNIVGWNKNRPPSSGVGKQMSEKLSRHAEFRIAKVRDVSYLQPVRCNSRMFPPEQYPRRPKWWGNDNFIDKEPPCDSDLSVTAE
jgi:hypothetical protein